MPLAPHEPILLLMLGLVAGAVGGLVGLGGSIVMVPALTLLLARDQQLAQASAMIVNVLIAIPSYVRHRLAGVVKFRVIWRMLPAATVFILIGVEVGNEVPSLVLQRLFGVFLVYAMLLKLVRYREVKDAADDPSRATWPRVSFVGGFMGLVAGLLGVGGGPVAVPMLQRVCRLPLRVCIASSAAVMCLTSTVGAVRKNQALGSLTDAAGDPLGLSVVESLWIAGLIAPTAMLGAFFGAGLTHRVPIKWLRIAFASVVSVAAVKMLGIV